MDLSDGQHPAPLLVDDINCQVATEPILKKPKPHFHYYRYLNKCCTNLLTSLYLLASHPRHSNKSPIDTSTQNQKRYPVTLFLRHLSRRAFESARPSLQNTPGLRRTLTPTPRTRHFFESRYATTDHWTHARSDKQSTASQRRTLLPLILFTARLCASPSAAPFPCDSP